MAVCYLGARYIQEGRRAIGEARANQLLVQRLNLAVEADREQTSTMLATGEVERTPENYDYEAFLKELTPLITPEDAGDLKKEVKAETDRLNEIKGMAQSGQLAAARARLAESVDGSTLDGHLDGLYRSFESTIAAREKELSALEWQLAVVMVFGMLLGLAIGRVVSVELNKRLVPLSECSLLAARMGEGDFSQHVPPVRYRDEIGSVTEAFGGCYRRLRDLSHKGQLLALELSVLANRVLENSRQQTAAVTSESMIAQEAADGLDEIGRGAGQMISLSEEVIQRARVTEASTRSGLQAVQDTVRSVGTTLEQLQAVGGIAVALSENTRIIGEVVSMINDISDRSNIVAINASILAAASGMEAKSFAVVAREMKSLADQSKDASAGVRGILKNIERGIQTCAHLTEEAVNQGKSTGAATDDSDITIRRLAENIKNSLQSFQETVNLTQGQQETCGRVAQSLARLQSSCSDSMRGARELESSAEELQKVAARMVTLMSVYKQAPDREELERG